MPVNEDLGCRMKENYEMRARTYLTRRTPVAIRIDGKAFHTFTKNFQKPFDAIFMTAMQNTMKRLCENIQGCVFGYTQSDEITLILIDYQNLNSDAWFDYQVQKMCSVAASMATLYFNQELVTSKAMYEMEWQSSLVPQSVEEQKNHMKYLSDVTFAICKGATFDARCFNIPKEEVTNLIYWRQLDAIRNSIQSCGQVKYSSRQLHGASCAVIKEMLHQDGYEWDKLPLYMQRGSACYKGTDSWVLDLNMPILKEINREYVDKFIYVGEEQ